LGLFLFFSTHSPFIAESKWGKENNIFFSHTGIISTGREQKRNKVSESMQKNFRNFSKTDIENWWSTS
jgi:hypothetical protein